MWTLPSLPAVRPSMRPMYWAKIRHGSVPRATWTPMSRWVGAPTSSSPIAMRHADGRRLVAAARVERAGDLALAEEDVAALLDAAGDEHQAVQLDEVLAVEADPSGLLERPTGAASRAIAIPVGA